MKRPGELIGVRYRIRRISQPNPSARIVSDRLVSFVVERGSLLVPWFLIALCSSSIAFLYSNA